jgi:hypothetical protein
MAYIYRAPSVSWRGFVITKVCLSPKAHRWRITRRCSGRVGQRAICTSYVQLNVSGVPPPAAELHALDS